MKKSLIIFLMLICGMLVSCGDKKTENNLVPVSEKEEIVLEQGTYYLNGTDEDEYILIDENNMLNLVGFDYQSIVDDYQKILPECDFTETDVKKMSQPHEYKTEFSREGDISIRPFEMKPTGILLHYNEDDNTLTCRGKDYILKED